MIRFYVGEGGSVLRDKGHVRAWLHEVLLQYGVNKANINYIFCGDEYLYSINVEFLGHDTYTDIITFPDANSDKTQKNTLAGECYISTDRVFDNAVSLGIPYSEELHRVMVHGLLHLLGQGDKSEEEAVAMRRKENDTLLMRKFHVEQSNGANSGNMHSDIEMKHEQLREKERLRSDGIKKFHVEQTNWANPSNMMAVTEAVNKEIDGV